MPAVDEGAHLAGLVGEEVVEQVVVGALDVGDGHGMSVP
jgi:hypothetical protein